MPPNKSTFQFEGEFLFRKTLCLLCHLTAPLVPVAQLSRDGGLLSLFTFLKVLDQNRDAFFLKTRILWGVMRPRCTTRLGKMHRLQRIVRVRKELILLREKFRYLFWCACTCPYAATIIEVIARGSPRRCEFFTAVHLVMVFTTNTFDCVSWFDISVEGPHKLVDVVARGTAFEGGSSSSDGATRGLRLLPNGHILH